jgi:hypothetical protein
MCPFCKTMRTSSKLAVVAVSSALALIGCDGVVSGGSKYGGPPPNYNPPAMTDGSDGTTAPSSTASSPRLNPTSSSDRVIAPATKYGGPPSTVAVPTAPAPTPTKP